VRTAAELVLGGEPDAVPRARHFTAASLVGEALDTVADAELIVTELITNAALHGEPPIVLRLSHHDGLIRIEVEDTGRAVPVRVRQSTEGMTGRGLSLVAALAGDWGIEPGSRGGKVVWAELAVIAMAGGAATETVIDVDALLASWEDEASAERRYAVRLGSVPTDLLLSAKAHIDNVVREMLLLRSAEVSTGDQLPPAMADLVETVTQDFVAARTEIKRQALAAAERGEVTTDLQLMLPLSAADAGERYIAALDQADRYARAARLLTMAPPRSHREFRRWYVQSLVDQLRAVARRETPQPAVPFSQILADEVDRLSGLEDTWDRLQLLQNVTAELTGARSVYDIATTVVSNAANFVGVETARVYVLEDGVLRTLAWHGRTSDHDVYDEFGIDSDVPGAVVARTGKPLFMRTLTQIYEQFPELDGYYPTERSLHVMPLTVGDHTLGLLALTFVGGELDEVTQKSFVQALADALAQAIERANAMAIAEAANERLTLLANASVALAASLDFDATLDAVTRLMVPHYADWCAVEVLRDGTLENVRLLHSDPDRVAWAAEMSERFPIDMNAPAGSPLVMRTGRSQVYPEVSQELLEASATDAEHLETIRQLRISSVLIVPLTGRGGILGVMTLIYAESGRRYSEADVPFLEDVARRAALALEAAETLREQSGRLAEVSRVAEAAQLAILAPPPARLGPVSLAARYASAAAEALVGGDLYEVVQRPQSVRLLIGDVRGKGLSAVRTATIVLGEFRAVAADVDDLGDLAAQIDRRVRSYLGDEDFVTALIAEITDDGGFAVACCGHPAPLLVADGAVRLLEVEPCLPLGLGAAPQVTTGRLRPGDRLLMYTDGIIEARDASGRFVDLMQIAASVADSSLDSALDRVLEALHRATGPELGDDLALLIAEYRP
jgi:serine phosphatase RsbU (regulator of sigma subunit)